MRYKRKMASSTEVFNTIKTPAKPPKKRPVLDRDIPKARADDDLSYLIEEPHHPDFPIIWVPKGDCAEVSKKVKENISNTWKVKPIGNTPRPGSLLPKMMCPLGFNLRLVQMTPWKE